MIDLCLNNLTFKHKPWSSYDFSVFTNCWCRWGKCVGICSWGSPGNFFGKKEKILWMKLKKTFRWCYSGKLFLPSWNPLWRHWENESQKEITFMTTLMMLLLLILLLDNPFRRWWTKTVFTLAFHENLIPSHTGLFMFHEFSFFSLSVIGIIKIFHQWIFFPLCLKCTHEVFFSSSASTETIG